MSHDILASIGAASPSSSSYDATEPPAIAAIRHAARRAAALRELSAADRARLLRLHADIGIATPPASDPATDTAEYTAAVAQLAWCRDADGEQLRAQHAAADAEFVIQRQLLDGKAAAVAVDAAVDRSSLVVLLKLVAHRNATTQKLVASWRIANANIVASGMKRIPLAAIGVPVMTPQFALVQMTAPIADELEEEGIAQFKLILQQCGWAVISDEVDASDGKRMMRYVPSQAAFYAAHMRAAITSRDY